jgi:hypothetical protein
MFATMTELTRSERIDRALAVEGRKQSYIVKKMNLQLPDGNKMSDYSFSRKKNGFMDFTDIELKILSEILGQDITN